MLPRASISKPLRCARHACQETIRPAAKTTGGGYRMHTVPPAVLHCTNCTSHLHLTPHTSHLPPRDSHQDWVEKSWEISHFFSTWTDKPYCKENTTTKHTTKHSTPLSLPPKKRATTGQLYGSVQLHLPHWVSNNLWNRLRPNLVVMAIVMQKPLLSSLLFLTLVDFKNV